MQHELSPRGFWSYALREGRVVARVAGVAGLIGLLCGLRWWNLESYPPPNTPAFFVSNMWWGSIFSYAMVFCVLFGTWSLFGWRRWRRVDHIALAVALAYSWFFCFVFW